MPNFSKFIDGQRGSQQMVDPDRFIYSRKKPTLLTTLLKREVLSTLKRKAAEQPLSVTQNILSEVLADSTPETNQTLPTMESLARVVQRSKAVSSGSAQHTEATSSDDFLLISSLLEPQG
ncbi:hypothetical protein ACHWQZ_G005947 [Mnemiopsis leidyi]